MWGLEDTISFLNSCEYPLKKSIRCNDLKISCEKLVKKLENKGFKLEKIPWLKHGFRILGSPVKPSLGATLEYLLGYYHIQGLASMIPAYQLNPTSKDVVLDMAAAPGSKTTQLCQIMRNEGIILAIEKNLSRIKSLISNINRLGCKNIIIINSDTLDLRLYELFDKILLDTPCSGEGLIPIDPSRKTKTTYEKLKEFSILQLKLIRKAYELLRDEGYLLYSTCSIAPEEDELVVNYAVEELGMKVIKINDFPHDNGFEEYANVKFSKDIKNCARLYPHKHGTEGFFLCLLKKGV